MCSNTLMLEYLLLRSYDITRPWHPRLNDKDGAANTVLAPKEIRDTYRGRLQYVIQLPVLCIALNKNYTFGVIRLLGCDGQVYQVEIRLQEDPLITVLGPWPTNLADYRKTEDCFVGEDEIPTVSYYARVFIRPCREL